MLEFVQENQGKDWESFLFKQNDASMGDRYFWACAFDAFDFIPGWTGSFKMPGKRKFVNEYKIPENFEVWKMSGESKALKCKIEFLYYADGRLQLNIDKGKCIYDKTDIIEYMSVMFKNRYYIKGFEDGYAQCENNFVSETGISINEAKSMLIIKPNIIN